MQRNGNDLSEKTLMSGRKNAWTKMPHNEANIHHYNFEMEGREGWECAITKHDFVWMKTRRRKKWASWYPYCNTARKIGKCRYHVANRRNADKLHPSSVFIYLKHVCTICTCILDIWVVRWWLAGEQGPNKDGKNDERTSAKLKNSESEIDRGGTLRSVSPRAGSQIDKKVTFDASKTTMKILSPLSAAKRSSILLDVWEPWGAWANKKRIKKLKTKSTGQTESYKFMTWKGRKGGVTKQSNEVTSNE